MPVGSVNAQYMYMTYILKKFTPVPLRKHH